MQGAVIIFPDDAIKTIRALIDLCCSITEETDILVLGDDGFFQESGFAVSADVRCIHWFKGQTLSLSWDITPHAGILADFIRKQGYELIVTPAGANGNRISPILSAMLDGSCLTDAAALQIISDKLYCTKSVYNMNLRARFIIKKFPAIISVLDILPQKPYGPDKHISVNTHISYDEPSGWYSDLVVEMSIDGDDIRNADSIIIAGRGTVDKAGYEKVKELSDLLNAKTGSTRPPVQEAIAPPENMVGISGAIVSPKKCLILGASGSAPFAVGVEKCGTIFGVNSDPNAALFSFCDFGLVDDCNTIVELLLQQLRREVDDDISIP